MKLIIPIYNSSSIAEGFNKTTEVCIYDPKEQEDARCFFVQWKTIIPSGSKITKRMNELGIHAVLTSEIQALALNLFSENNILVYKSIGHDLAYNLSLYSQNKLSLFTMSDALENRVICSGTCDSCTTDNPSCSE
ncbi:MAG: NifB/NifX family molybdenum-iron cluster-binding protein [Bacteroidales bacterium]